MSFNFKGKAESEIFDEIYSSLTEALDESMKKNINKMKENKINRDQILYLLLTSISVRTLVDISFYGNADYEDILKLFISGMKKSETLGKTKLKERFQ